MNKLKTFFRSLYLSATNPSYYRDILRTKMSFSVKYFLMLSLFMGVVSTIVWSSILIPQIKSFSQTLKSKAETYFPNDLVITLQNGKLSTNRKDPIIVALPFETANNAKNIVIDPTASVSAMENYQAGILINETAVSFVEENGQIQTYPLKEAGNFTLNKTEYSKIITTAEKYMDTLPSLLPAGLLVLVTFFSLIGLALKILLYSVLTYIVARLQNFSLTYQKSFQITIHAITPIVFLQIIETIFNIRIPIPFFFPILYVILLVIIVKELKKEPILPITSNSHKPHRPNRKKMV